jgi:hypothetical protein
VVFVFKRSVFVPMHCVAVGHGGTRMMAVLGKSSCWEILLARKITKICRE